MSPLGDNFMVASDGFSWLLWVHLLVMFLLIILLSNFTIFGFDGLDKAMPGDFIFKEKQQMKDLLPYNNNSCSSSSSSSLQDSQVNEGRRTSVKGDSSSTRSTRRRREREADEIPDVDSSSIRQRAETTPVGCYFHHPCYYLDLARRAVLKCLGLDSTYEDSSTAQQRSRTQ